MKSIPDLADGGRWMWWACGAAFAVGIAMGWWRIRSGNEQLPVPACISGFRRERIQLDHPLSRDVPANPPGTLCIRFYSGREPAGPPLAVVEEPPSFDVNAPWLKALIRGKLDRSPGDFSLRMRGWIAFQSPRTILHVRSDDGCRIRFRNALGREEAIMRWVEGKSDDFAVDVVAEPGRYEIEIEYFNVGWDFFLRLWGTPRVDFEPAPEPHDDRR